MLPLLPLAARLRIALSWPVRMSPLFIACWACAPGAPANIMARTAAARADDLPKSLRVISPLPIFVHGPQNAAKRFCRNAPIQNKNAAPSWLDISDRDMPSEQRPLPNRPRQRTFIEIVEFAADRHA